MGMHDSESVEDLLKQLNSTHNSMKIGLQSQVSELKKKIADLETIIAKCSSCSKCGDQLVKSQTKISQHSSENAKKVKNDNSIAEDVIKELTKISNEIANDKSRIVEKSKPKPVVREKPILETDLNETPSLLNVKKDNSTAEDVIKIFLLTEDIAAGKCRLFSGSIPKPVVNLESILNPVVKQRLILESDVNETPSLLNVENDNSTAEDDNKRLKISNEIANDKSRIVVKSKPKPVVNVEKRSKPVVRVALTCGTYLNDKKYHSTAEDNNTQAWLIFDRAAGTYVVESRPRNVVRVEPLIKTDLNETPSLLSVKKNNSTAKDDNSTAKDDNKRYVLIYDKAARKYVLESRPKPVVNVESRPKPVVNVESRPKPVVNVESRPKPVVNVESRPKTVVNVESRPKSVVNVESRPKPVVNVESRPKTVVNVESRPKSVVRKKPILETDLNVTPSIHYDSWAYLNDTPLRKSVSPLDKQIKNTFGDKKEQILTKRNNNKPVQVTLEKAFHFSAEKKRKYLNETIKDSDVSPSILHCDPVTTAAQENDFSQNLSEDYPGFEQLTNKCTEKTEKTKNGFKNKAEVTRNREDEAKLDGFGCLDCKNYVAGLNINEEKKKLWRKTCLELTVRDNHVPSPTPTTQEAKERGYIKSTQYSPLKSRKKRKLME